MTFARGLPAALLGLLLTAGAAAAEPIHVVALGASVTNGKGVDRDTAFPAQIEKLLRAEGYDVRVTNAGIDDDTPGGMLQRLSRDVPEGTSIVIFQAGANDKYSGKEGAARVLAALRERRIRVMVYPSGALEQQGRTVAQEYDAVFLGRTLMEGMGGTKGSGIDKRYLLPDGIHFNPDGHKLAASLMAQEIKKQIAARPAPAAGDGSGGRQGGRAEAQFDANGDGAVTLDEFIAGRRRMFASMDTNHDSVVSRDEFTAGLPPQLPPQMQDRVFTRADGNGDGRITAEEFDSASQEIFRTFDRSGTGRLSAEEVAAMRPATLLGMPGGGGPAAGAGGGVPSSDLRRRPRPQP